MEKRISNYDITKKRMQPEFLKYDQSEMIRKFCLENDADSIYITLFSRKYRIDRKSGAVYLEKEEADHNAAMTIYDILCWSKPDCAPSGELVNMHSLSTLHSSSVTLGGGLFENVARYFDGKERSLENALVSLGGEKWGRGDVAYKIPMFGNLWAGVMFWSADDEFPASLSLMVDKNLLQYMHFETMWYVLSLMLEIIKAEMAG
ncbi:MAG: DUF3786 domain-containing protein [Oscillospiraceae bacterium]|nr:DUF3786 domain-containing protein [Oscillospiraceae bacterium]